MAIVRNKGYVQLRRGLFEHVQNGEMSIGECFLYAAILANADPSTGVWISSAGMLSSYYSIPNRTCKDWLAKLEEKRYLRRFRVQGKHGQYPILVHKFQCTEGALKGMRLNAWHSEPYKSPKYEPCPDACPDGAPAGALTVPQSTRERENKRKGNAPKAAPSSFELPDWINQTTWGDFEEMRRKKRAPMTDRARRGIVSRLEGFRQQGQDVEAVLLQSITKSYRDVFPISKLPETPASGHKKPSQYELAAKLQLEERRRAMREAGIQ